MGRWIQTEYIFAVFRLIFCPKPLFGDSFAGDKPGSVWEQAPARECPPDQMPLVLASARIRHSATGATSQRGKTACHQPFSVCSSTCSC